ncbi:MAG: hypothetical protein AMXMBFR34_19470 [Myxococcaceae bacterium]
MGAAWGQERQVSSKRPGRRGAGALPGGAAPLQSKQGYGKAALEAEVVGLMAAQAWPDEN